MQNMPSVRDVEVSGKRVLVRVDFNVPITDGVVVDDARIRAALPTIQLLLERGAAEIMLLTHIGRPKGTDQSLSVLPVEKRLRELGVPVSVVLHENLRFDPREEANDPAFAQELATLGDVYINDAFSNAHREHASMVGVPKLLPHAAGLHMLDEIAHLEQALTPPKGSLAIIGGAKFETKLPLFQRLLQGYEALLLGGALANDLYKARGFPFGASVVSDQPVPMDLALDERIFLPGDITVVELGQHTERMLLPNDIRANERAVDIGPKTIEEWSAKIAAAPFVLWNGPVGVYEEGYNTGTLALAQALAKSAARAVVGGGDTVAALQTQEFSSERIFVSMGGGAMLQFLADGTLPAIEALKR